MTPLIKLQEMNTVLFESIAAPVSVTHDEMYHGTVTHNLLYIQLSSDSIFVTRYIFDVYDAHLRELS